MHAHRDAGVRADINRAEEKLLPVEVAAAETPAESAALRGAAVRSVLPTHNIESNPCALPEKYSPVVLFRL